MAIRSEIARAAQARDPDRIEHEVVGFRIEQRAGGVEIAGACRHLGDKQLGVAGAVDVAGLAADAGLSRNAAEDAGRTERQIAEIYHIRLGARGFRPEHFARPVERILVEFGFRRQRGLITVDRKGSGASVKSRHETSEREGNDAQSPNSHRAAASSVGRRSPSLVEAFCSATTSSSLTRRNLGMSTPCRSRTTSSVLSSPIFAPTVSASLPSAASSAAAKIVR